MSLLNDHIKHMYSEDFIFTSTRGFSHLKQSFKVKVFYLQAKFSEFGPGILTWGLYRYLQGQKYFNNNIILTHYLPFPLLFSQLTVEFFRDYMTWDNIITLMTNRMYACIFKLSHFEFQVKKNSIEQHNKISLASQITFKSIMGSQTRVWESVN